MQGFRIRSMDVVSRQELQTETKDLASQGWPKTRLNQRHQPNKKRTLHPANNETKQQHQHGK